MKETDNQYNMDGHKLLWHLDRVKEWQEGKRIAPLHIDMGITTGCNMACKYCYGVLQGRKNVSERFDMPLETIKRFFSDAKKEGVRSIALIGEGENTLNKNLYKAIEHGGHIGLDLGLSTNGLALSEEKLEIMLKNLIWIRFNVSAAKDESYRLVHGVDQFEKFKEHVLRTVETKKKLESKTTIGLQMVVIKENMGDIVALAELGRELGVDYLVIKPCSDDPESSLNAPHDDYVDLEKVFQEAEAFSHENYKVIVKWSKMANRGVKRFKTCLGTQFIINVSGDGSVFPCGHFFNINREKFFMGSIVNDSFSDILKSSRYWEVQNRIQEVDTNCECETNCRHYYISDFLWGLKNPPSHINFI